MAEQASQQDERTSENGHRPPGVTWTQTLEVMVKSDDDGLFITTLTHAVVNDGNGCLFQPHVKQRCARIKLGTTGLYEGTILELVSAAMPMRWREWAHDIDVLVLAMAQLDIVPLSAIEPEEIVWLWQPYIPLKKLTLFEGDPSAGKTYLLLAIGAAITRGFSLPDQEGRVATPTPGAAGNVLYITAEDGLADTLRPRAEKVGADLDKFFVPTTPQSFSLSQPQILAQALARFRPKLLVLDPLQAFLGAEIDMHRANEVRPLMTTLLALAIEYECAVVCVRHWTKASGGRARHRGQGNVDFAAAARSVLSVGESPEDESLRIMAHAKPSLSKVGASIVFRITDEGLEWCGTSTLTADELSAAQPQRHREQRKDAMQWLREFLHDGPQPAQLTEQAAASVGIGAKTLRGARERLHVLSNKDGHTWYWRLPTFKKQWERYPGYEDDRDVTF